MNWFKYTYLSGLRGWCGGFNSIIGDPVTSVTSVSWVDICGINWSGEPAAAARTAFLPVL